MDLVIKDTTLATMRGNSIGIIRNGSLGVKEDKIAFVGPSDQLRIKGDPVVIDGSNHATMPGLVNAHTHSGRILLRGVAQVLPEIQWMTKGLGPFAKHMSGEDLVVGAQLALVEGIRGDTTTWVEYSAKMEKLLEYVFLPAHVRTITVETFNEVVGDTSRLKPTDPYQFDQQKGDRGLKRALDIKKKFAKHSLIKTMLGPQALDMVSLTKFKEITSIALEQNLGVHTHLAQGRREKMQIQARFLKRITTFQS